MTPRERQSLVSEEEEEQKPVQQTDANGGAVEKAPAPDAKEMLTSKTMSVADQLATGLLTAGEHLQAGSLPFVPFTVLPLVAIVPFNVLPIVPSVVPPLCL